MKYWIVTGHIHALAPNGSIRDFQPHRGSRPAASILYGVQGKHAKLQRVLSCLSDVHTILVALTESHVFVLSTPRLVVLQFSLCRWLR
jgi:hypothetical protein